MFLVEEMQDLDVTSFNKETCHHTIFKFGPVRWYLHCVSSEIRGAQFHDINMVCNSIGQDLIEALVPLKGSTTIVCEALKMRFKNNHNMDAIMVLEPYKHAHTAGWIDILGSTGVGYPLCLL